jgi:hypothetical protein
MTPGKGMYLSGLRNMFIPARQILNGYFIFNTAKNGNRAIEPVNSIFTLVSPYYLNPSTA